MSSSSTCYPLHRRADSPTRGRHLVATQDIPRGRLILAERPLVALQSLDNQQEVKVCHCCKAFIGGPDFALLQRFVSPPDVETEEDTSTDLAPTNEDSAQDNSDYAVVPCRNACGHLYCSKACEADAWCGFHCALCTGLCASADEPLVQFKMFAAETNEILLMVAEWWVAQHLCRDSTYAQRYTDFCMPLWWDVTAHPILSEVGSSAENILIEESTREICAQAADWLNQVWQIFNERKASNDDENDKTIPPISDQDIARWIGACEQNSMGIRQRHPLCRSVLEDDDVRQRRHHEIVQCLVEAGFIGDDEKSNGDDSEIEPEEAMDEVAEDSPAFTTDVHPAIKPTERIPQWNYSLEDIEKYLAESLFIDEDSSVCDAAVSEDRVRDTVGDDLDYIFPPLDGTAMYYTACKMNHSCNPNVIVLYKGRGWGRSNPLAVYCIAYKDIQKGEELTISYIESNEPVEKRQEQLANYGFVCTCSKCTTEKYGTPDTDEMENPSSDVNTVDDLFGDDDAEDDRSCENSGESFDQPVQLTLQQKVERLDSAVNHSKFASLPLEIRGKVAAFALQAGRDASNVDDKTIQRLWEHCRNGLQEGDFVLCKIAGCDLEQHLYGLLQKHSAWPSTSHRIFYRVACLAASLGLSHECSFVSALGYLDKGMMLGISRQHILLSEHVKYVEWHAGQVHAGPYTSSFQRYLPDLSKEEDKNRLELSALSKPMENHVVEGDCDMSPGVFAAEFVAGGRPVVFRGLASKWTCTESWRVLNKFGGVNGTRLVPIEVGSMMNGKIQEQTVSLRTFIDDYLSPSMEKECRSLRDAIDNAASVAYMAQHPLTDQIPSLKDDIDERPSLCGQEGPTHTYFWFGSAGTRTPLHFDSYENLFVQVVGAKYARLYDASEASKLYVNKSGYGLQGNMSEVDCENEDFAKHPLAESAQFQEVLLYPGGPVHSTR